MSRLLGDARCGMEHLFARGARMNVVDLPIDLWFGGASAPKGVTCNPVPRCRRPPLRFVDAFWSKRVAVSGGLAKYRADRSLR
jgi:hypothetical protein